ncbi:TonB-dependent receptor [Plebeiibacterium sediminum]|uniref:TonB-dependent receptor plug domain-containing protein n=1 Tax=Plebeiibacterium sediminum TaxID=2992112 RepID=A0AAE3SIJ9_9BACT|nr:TonB-dependent receptor plug domain-containing protein [Plebeiobacterium sediminum]MCW3789318.1 TonB-dependent receptor plug domain-containing protein [Plebeiobacterium sediminum]
MIVRIGLLITLLFFVVNTLSAQLSVIDTTESIIMKEVRVRAPLLIENVHEWPGGYVKMDSLTIQSGSGYVLSEQLNTIPGVFMQQGTLSTNRITIRGIGSRTPYNSNRIKAYWGDIPITDGDGVTAIEDIGLNDISDIQVLKGPASALYGAGLGGVVLISPHQLKNSSKNIVYKSEYSRYNTFLNQINLNLLQNKSSSVNLNASYLNSDGYRENSNYERHNVTLNASHQQGKSNFKLFYHYSRLYGQIPSSLDSLNFYDTPQKATFTWVQIKGYEKSYQHILSGRWAFPISKRMAHSVNLFYRISNLNELRPFNRLHEGKNSIGLRDKLVYKKDKIRAILGVELLHERNSVKYFSVDEEDYGSPTNANKLIRYYANVFSVFESRIIPDLLMQASLNLNKTGYRSIADDENFSFDWIASPRLGFNYTVGKQHNILGSIGHGFSQPSFEESLMPDGSFNHLVKPEQGIGIEVGYRYASMNNKLNLDLTLYQLQMKNLLVTKRESEDIFYGVNAGKTKHYGMEASLMYNAFRTEAYSLNMRVNYFTSQNEFVDFVDDGQDQKGNQLPGIPNHILSYQITSTYKAWTVNLSYKNIGKQYLTDDNTKMYNGYQKLDGKLNYKLEILNVEGNVYMGCNNIFNEHYASMVLINASSFGNNKPRYYYPALPTHVYGGITLKF